MDKFPEKISPFFISCFLFFALFFSSNASAIVSFAPIRNFSALSYNSGTQNWEMAQDKLGRVYIANRDGLLRYDGVSWMRLRLPNYTSVRSIFIDDKLGRIYVGGSGEFGYFQETGAKEKYVSLVGNLPDNERNFTEIWNIFRDNNGTLYFQGDFRIFAFKADKCSVIPFNNRILTSSIPLSNGFPYIATENGAISFIKKLKVHKISGCESIKGLKVAALLPFDKNSILIATAFNGLFIHNGSSISKLSTPIDNFLQENQIFCATRNGDDVAFGTVNCGAVIYNIKSGKTSFINRRTGLQNNTVLGINYDYNKSLWLCLDNGVSLAMTDSPVGNLLGADSESGAGYASLFTNNILLLGTNQALFYVDDIKRISHIPPSPVKLLNGQVWSIDTIANTIFVASDRGLFTADRKNPTKFSIIPDIPGSWSVKALKKYPGYALISTYDKFHILHFENGSWKNLGKVSGYDDVCSKVVEDRNGDLWMAHWLKGVFHFKLNPYSKKISSLRLIDEKRGLATRNNNSVSIYNGRVIISGEGGLYKVSKDDHAVRDDDLTSYIPLYSSAHIYSFNNNQLFAVSPKIFWDLHSDNSGKMSLDSTSFRSVCRKILPGFENLGLVDNNLIVSNQDGFFIIDRNKRIKRSNNFPVFINAIYANQDSLVYRAGCSSANAAISLPYSLNSLSFEFALPEFRDDANILFSCMLENYDNDWSPLSNAHRREYTKLHEGEYTLHFRALNPATGEISESSSSFSIAPPWFRSTAAYLLYFAAIIAFFYFATIHIRNFSLRAAHRIELRKEEELRKMKEAAEKENLQKDYEIAALKSEKLEHDIKHKSSELSNITMNVIRKNEILTDISNRLARLIQGVHNRGEATSGILDRDIERIQKIIRENISHDDDWKNFNLNFDIVYENYTKRLVELHPDLNKSDLRICCYIKMGLSSKDIAPLFNITPRSVEMSRYRIRKKMNLTRETSLTSYLQNI